MASAACDLDELHLQVDLHRNIDGFVCGVANSKLARLCVTEHEGAVWVFILLEARHLLLFGFWVIMGPNRLLSNRLILGPESVARGVVTAHTFSLPNLRGGLRTVESVRVL